MTRSRGSVIGVVVLIGLVVVLATTTVAWALSGAALSPVMTATRAVSDAAAALTLGLTVVARLDEPRYRTELVRRATRPLTVAAGVWLVAELLRVVLAAAQTAATPLTALPVRTLAEFAWSTAPGRAALFSLVTAALVVAGTLLARPVPALMVGMTGLATAGIAARAVTGHIAQNVFASAAVVAHSLAASLWFGVLGALALTVSARGQWARVLPEFSRLALPCVAVLLVGGLIAAYGAVTAPADLLTTGYGRVLLAKVAVTAGVLLLAWTNRNGWLRIARAHRVTAETSLTRSVVELGVLTIVLTLAAGLTVAG